VKILVNAKLAFFDEPTISSLARVILTHFLAISTATDCIDHLKRIRVCWNSVKTQWNSYIYLV